MFEVVLAQGAADYLDRLDVSTQRILVAPMERLSTDPIRDAKRRMLTVGGWTICYQVQEDLRQVWVSTIEADPKMFGAGLPERSEQEHNGAS
ncbi:MAG: hypothetical protein M1415_03125 [Firmicutes bacterium]|jgi:hypothetical protein|nr:hypothetical protein [Bacillota bacterium]MCL5065387.1 hypothetical protein [Bacillota bacterium]